MVLKEPVIVMPAQAAIQCLEWFLSHFQDSASADVTGLTVKFRCFNSPERLVLPRKQFWQVVKESAPVFMKAATRRPFRIVGRSTRARNDVVDMLYCSFELV
jgi:hypothetical protein